MKHEVHSERHKDLIVNIQNYFNQEKSQTIFQQRNTIKLVPFEGREYMVKSFKVPHLLNQFIYSFFRHSKAKKSYFNSIKIINFVPAPVGYVEFKRGFLLKESYFVNEPFEHDFTIREPLTSSTFEDKEKIYQEFAKFTNQLHKRGILHLDYSPGNILIKMHPYGRYEFKIIDINRMVFKKELTTQERLENFAKLWASNEDLEMIIKEYTKINKLNELEALNIALKASQKHKNRINFKKRLKGKKVVD
jgi:serine/threonine protein kinase